MSDAGATGGEDPQAANLHVLRRDQPGAGRTAAGDTLRRAAGDGTDDADARGVRIVLLHGITDSGACWETVAAGLDPSFDIVMPDARGHGATPLPDGPVSVEIMADDVAATLSASAPAVVIGHSMGAATAIALAALHPRLVRALVLEDPPWAGGLDGEPTFPASFHGDGAGRDEAVSGASDEHTAAGGASAGNAAADEPLGPPDFAAWIRGLQALDHAGRVAAGRVEAPHWSDAELQRWAVAKDQVDVRFFDRIDHASVLGSHRYLADLTVPTLLVTGEPELGAFVSAETADQARSEVANLEVLHLAGTGHSVHRDRLDDYLDGLHSFLDRHLA